MLISRILLQICISLNLWLRKCENILVFRRSRLLPPRVVELAESDKILPSVGFRKELATTFCKYRISIQRWQGFRVRTQPDLIDKIECLAASSVQSPKRFGFH